MSRSIKKRAWIKDNQHSKKIFNRRIRRSMKDLDLPSGNYYKRLNDSWEQCDYKFPVDKEDCDYTPRQWHKMIGK